MICFGRENVALWQVLIAMGVMATIQGRSKYTAYVLGVGVNSVTVITGTAGSRPPDFALDETSASVTLAPGWRPGSQRLDNPTPMPLLSVAFKQCPCMELDG